MKRDFSSYPMLGDTVLSGDFSKLDFLLKPQQKEPKHRSKRTKGSTLQSREKTKTDLSKHNPEPRFQAWRWLGSELIACKNKTQHSLKNNNNPESLKCVMYHTQLHIQGIWLKINRKKKQNYGSSNVKISIKWLSQICSKIIGNNEETRWTGRKRQLGN